MSVNTYLINLSNKLVLSSIENSSIQTSIRTLEKRVRDHFNLQIVEQIQFGSSTRETMLPRKADAQSDVDYMLVFGDGSNVKPTTLIQRLGKFATDRYLSSEVFQSHPTIVLNLNHIKFELVPAYKTWGTYYIPGASSSWSEWTHTDPNGFNTSLANRHRECNYLLKPMVRLIKYWNATNGYIYESFLLEKDLVSRYYPYCTTVYDYVQMYFENVNAYSLPQYKREKVDRAKTIMIQVKAHLKVGDHFSAEKELRKIFIEL